MGKTSNSGRTGRDRRPDEGQSGVDGAEDLGAQTGHDMPEGFDPREGMNCMFRGGHWGRGGPHWGGRGGHHWGGRGGHHWDGGHHEKQPKFHSSFTSESSSDSESDCDRKRHKKMKKEFKKQWKSAFKSGGMRGMGGMAGMRGMGGLRGMGHHMGHHFRHFMFMPDLNASITVCTLCCHRIKPLTETDVLECGHLFHRRCLKELFDLALKSEERDVFCSQCKQKVDENLVNRLKARFGEQSTPQQNSGQQMVVDITN